MKNETRTVFRAECTYFGWIEDSSYREFEFDCGEHISCFHPIALYYEDAIKYLHEWILENWHLVYEYPKASWKIEAVDGSLNKWGDLNYKVVYSKTSGFLKKYLLKEYMTKKYYNETKNNY